MMPASSPPDRPRTDPVELRVLLKGSSNASDPKNVWITPDTIRENQPVKATIGKGAVKLYFGGSEKGDFDYFSHFDFENATGTIYKFDTEMRYKWASNVQLRWDQGLRDGVTRVFDVLFQWPEDGSDNQGMWGRVGVTHEPPFIEVLLRIPLRPSSR